MGGKATKGIYKRHKKLWVWIYDASGERQFFSTPYRPGEEAKAVRYRQALLDEVESQKDLARADGQQAGPPTLRRYAKIWCEKRRQRGLSSAYKDEQRLKQYILPFRLTPDSPAFGDMLVVDFRPRHIRELVLDLSAKMRANVTNTSRRRGIIGSPRMVHRIYETVVGIFRDAFVDGLVEVSPCVLSPGDLPVVRDKDPTWRRTAVFTLAELGQLISNPCLPTDRRTIYALLFLTGGRVGEISALKWSVYDTQAFPLGAMVIAFSYDSAGRKVKGTKTEVTREVPVHPVLAHLLSEWRSTGWEAMMGRPPTADDLIVPDRPDGLNRKKSHFPFRAANLVYKAMLRDLELLGLRKRRIHDARRTFVSVCMDAGMNKDIVQRFTHVSQNEQSAFGLYNSPLWRRQCEEMLRLDLSEVLDGELGRIVTASVTGLIRPRNREGNRVGARGFEPLKHPISLNEPEVDSVDFTHGGTSSNAVELVAVEPACHSAVTARPGDFPETLQSLVEGVRAKDRRAVRRALLELLQKLDED